jgi:N-acetylglucosaminyldiphosphoundecaprenol N-acetyl-beta-D-mannosaminyltransferase
MNKINFLGLDLVNAIFIDFFEEIKLILSSSNSEVSQKIIFTPNPEMYVEMQKNKDFFDCLKKADYLLPDGFGILLWSKLLFGKKFEERLTGVDFTEELLKFGKSKVYIVGGQVGAAKVVDSKFESVVGFFDGIVNEANTEKIISEINSSEAEIVLVALGAPKQEFWIIDNLKLLPKVKLFAGIGGSIDFMSGVQKRAPLVFRKLGLEWLWRLFLEPKRIVRISRATIVFSWICIHKRLSL